MSLRSAWKRGQHGWPKRYPIAQFPNAPLLASLAGSVVHKVTDGDTADYGWAVSRMGLAIWAYLELTAGVNLFRRALGVVGLVLTAKGLADR